MKNLFLIPLLSLLLYSCGGDEETPAAAAPPPNKETTHTSESVIENPMDSVLMAEFMALTKGTQSTDSLKMQLDALSNSNDSLTKMLLKMQDTLNRNFPIKFPEPKIDHTDYNKPPDGDLTRNNYKVFDGAIPSKEKPLKAFPKELIGSYVSSINSKTKLKITSTDITYTNKTDTAIFIISSNRNYTTNSNIHILNYQTKLGWVAVLLTLNGNNLSFKIIPKNAVINTSPSYKELKQYFSENSGTVLNVFMKVN